VSYRVCRAVREEKALAGSDDIGLKDMPLGREREQAGKCDNIKRSHSHTN
jgi:hypothetical protein